MEKKQAKPIVERLIARSGSSAALKLKGRFPGGRNVGGKYTMGDHSITLYLDEINKQALRLFGTLDVAGELLKIIAAHELGHAEDARLPELSSLLDTCASEPERNRIALQIEENAWNYAVELLSEELRSEADAELLKAMIHYSLQPYREAVAESIA